MGIQGTWFYALVNGVPTQTGYQEIFVPGFEDTPAQQGFYGIYPPAPVMVQRGPLPGELAFTGTSPPNANTLSAAVFPVPPA